MQRVKRILVLLFALAVIAAAALPAAAAEDYRISQMSSEYTVTEDGTCTAVITVRAEFSAAMKTLTVPLPPDCYDITVAGYTWSEKTVGNRLELTLNSPSGFTGSRDIVISFRQTATVQSSGDGQLMKLHLLYSQWNCAIENFKLTVRIPAETEGLPDFVGSYYGEQADNYLDIRLLGNTLSVSSLQELNAQESLVMNWEFPDGFFDLRFMQGRSVKLDIILFFVFAGLCVLYWLVRLGSKPLRYKPQAMPPMGCNAGLVPYLLGIGKPSVGLMTAHWGTLGYLSVRREKRTQRSELLLQMEIGNERKPYEAQLFNDFFSHRDTCRTDAPAVQTVRNRCQELVPMFWRKKLYSKRNGMALVLRILGLISGFFSSLYVFDSLISPRSFRWFLIIPLTLLGTLALWSLQYAVVFPLRRRKGRLGLAILCSLTYLLTAAIISGSIAMALGGIFVQLLAGVGCFGNGRRTPTGRAQLTLLLGLRKYLKKLKEPEARRQLENDPQYFYRMLPFAEALGIGAAFAKRFAFTDLEPCYWFDWKGKQIVDSRAFRDYFVTVLNELDDRPKELRL